MPNTKFPLSAVGTFFDIACGDFNAASIQLTGTWVGTVVFEGSNDDQNWFQVPVVSSTYLGASAGVSLTATTSGMYFCVIPFAYFRARLSAWTSGTVTAIVQFCHPTYTPISYNTTVLGAGTAAIGSLTAGSATIGGTINASWFTDTATALSAGATFTGTSRDLGAVSTTVPWSYFNASFDSDQAGTAYIEYSTDNVNWSTAQTSAVAANVVSNIRSVIVARYWRTRFVNGATLQTRFRVSSSFTAN